MPLARRVAVGCLQTPLGSASSITYEEHGSQKAIQENWERRNADLKRSTQTPAKILATRMTKSTKNTSQVAAHARLRLLALHVKHVS
eukprot:6183053-Pleurochrysis_carterae.AAC.1